MAINRLSQSSVQNGLPKFDTVWDGYTNPSAMDSLGVVTVTSAGATTLTFSNIPQTYSHLQIRGFVKVPAATSIICRFNSDSSNNYSRHYLQGNGASVTSSGSVSQSSIINFFYADSSATSNYGAFVTDILDYTSSNKNKTTRSTWGQDYNGSGYIGFDSASWFATPAAITSITLSSNAGQTISEHSSFALYGIK